MFKLEFLKLKDHPQLGNLEINFFDLNDLENSINPYSSILIGPNGTGKSYVLRTIAEIFRALKNCQSSNTGLVKLSFGFDIQYYIGINQYRVELSKFPNKRKKGLNIFKNAYSFNYLNRKGNFIEGLKESLISVSDLEFPNRVIVNSVMLTDRFVWQNSNPTDFYQYLGVRSTKTTANTKSSSRRTIKYLLNEIQTNIDFIRNLKDLLKFLEFEESFEVHYLTKVNKLFFSGNLTLENFTRYFEEWWMDDFVYSRRNKDNPLWSIPYYNNNFKDNIDRSHSIIDFLNRISSGERSKLKHKPNSPSKRLPINIFDNTWDFEDLEMIGHLESLDIINLEGIKIRKSNSTLSINEVSSGEYHMLITLIGMFSSIKSNSIILIDEPEISLHPNWQMKYISFLKKVFSNFSDSHFIVATHSHFLVSDLEGESSSVIALSRDAETNTLSSSLLKGTDTYGWSAEQVLLDVFDVPTTRNYAVAEKLGLLLDYIADERNDEKAVKNKFFELELDKLEKLQNTDPLKEVYNTIIKEYDLGWTE